MATITILTDLATFTPVYNRMEVAVEADAVTLALDDMHYIFDVYIENVSTPTFKRFKVPPDPSFSLGVVDIQRYCESACRSTLATYNGTVPFSLGANADGTQSIIKINIRYGYSYNNAGVYTVVTNVTTGADRYAFLGSLTEFAFMGWTPGDYLCNITNGANAQFLTDMKTNKVSINNLGWHHILSDTPTQVDYISIVTFDSSGNVIQILNKQNSVAQNLTASRMYKVATGPESLNNMTGAFTLGTPPCITSDVASYTIQLFDATNAPVSELLYFEMAEPCRYEQRRVHFLNRLGSFDAYNFNLRSQIEETTESKSFKYNKYPLNSTGLIRQYQDQAQVVSFVRTQEYLTVRSDYLTTEQHDWLKQLVQSPEIYLEVDDHNGDRNFVAYEKVEQTSWVEKETSIDKLFILELKLKLSQQNYRQRR